jgi:cell division protein ZapA
MAEVALDIGGRSYTLACRDGSEAHLRTLAKTVDAKVAEAREAVGSTSEVRQLLFAALLLADDVAERAPVQDDAGIAAALAALADRIERVADALETSPANA